jgi:hypothetical protein
LSDQRLKKPQFREQAVWNQEGARFPEGEFREEKKDVGRQRNPGESANGAILYQPGASPQENRWVYFRKG